MSIIPDCSSSLIFIQSQLDEKFRLALRQTFIDASNNYNTNENVENNCRRRTPVLDVSRVTCPPVKNNCKPYFNECKKNKIFNMQNQSNSSHKITQKDQYLRFVRGFGRNGHRRITNASQNFLFTNPNVSNFKIFNNKPNVLNICPPPPGPYFLKYTNWNITNHPESFDNLNDALKASIIDPSSMGVTYVPWDTQEHRDNKYFKANDDKHFNEVERWIPKGYAEGSGNALVSWIKHDRIDGLITVDEHGWTSHPDGWGPNRPDSASEDMSGNINLVNPTHLNYPPNPQIKKYFSDIIQ